MRFGVLGPFLVLPGTACQVTGRKHRTILAVLAIAGSLIVPLDRLEDELWPEGPPLSSRNLLRQYVSQLRRDLGHVGADKLLQTHAGGYRLDLSEGDLDRDEFDLLVHRGRAALAKGAPAEAAEQLRAALSLWRGEPLIDVVQSRSISAESRRLRDRQLTAIELRIEADMALGNYIDVVDELASLTTLHPARERLSALLMEALYATGRGAEALAAFRAAREYAVNELGLEPGPALRQLHQRILTDDLPVHERPPPTPLPSRPRNGPPRQLPPDIADLVGRAAELSTLCDSLDPEQDGRGHAAAAAVTIVSGRPGVGKSVLAVRAGHRLADRFPDGVVWVDAERELPGETTPWQSLAHVSAALNLPGDRDLQRFHAELARRRVLLVLDGVHHHEHVRRLTPANPECAVIVTSRSVLAGVEGARHIQCDPLDNDDAIALLTAIVPAQRLRDDGGGGLHALAEACQGLPLALRIAGMRLVALRGGRPAELAGRIRDDPLTELRWHDLALRPRLAAEVDRLDGLTRRVLRQLAAHGRVLTTTDAEAAARLLRERGQSPAAAPVVLDELVERHLLDVEPSGAYVIEPFTYALLRSR